MALTGRRYNEYRFLIFFSPLHAVAVGPSIHVKCYSGSLGLKETKKIEDLIQFHLTKACLQMAECANTRQRQPLQF